MLNLEVGVSKTVRRIQSRRVVLGRIDLVYVLCSTSVLLENSSKRVGAWGPFFFIATHTAKPSISFYWIFKEYVRIRGYVQDSSVVVYITIFS